VEREEAIVVGVNRYVEAGEADIELMRVDPELEMTQRQQLAALRQRRDNDRVTELRGQLNTAAQSDENLMPLLIESVESDVTLGEICGTLRDVWGEYRPVAAI
jgi:methylmalonyl-CoA mutase, N-terminal domain